MNRSLKLSALVALALGSAPALALTLGQIQVKSALDRPLVAVIPLHEDFPGEANHLTVALAPDAAFTRAGINRASLKVPLTFTVTTDAQGQKVIRITSAEPVREPYLDFLVRVNWPKGKLLREYVVLLDPLSMSAAPAVTPATVAPATVAPPAARTAPPAAAPTPSPAAAPPAATASTPAAAGAHGTAYTVQAGDTLTRIAQANAIAGVSYQQMLIALKTTNPDAFFRNNVNALKAGAILRLPTRDQALAVTETAAIDAVRQQNAAWRSTQPASPTLVASAGGSSAPVNAPAGSSAPADRLKLVPPKAGSGEAGSGGGAQATITQLRQDLARNKEALSSQKQESADLQSRVNALRKIADQNKRLLGLKDAQIAELQDTLAQARKAAGKPTAPAATHAAAATPITAAAVAATPTPAKAPVTAAASTTTAAAAVAVAPSQPAASHAPAAAKAEAAAAKPAPARPAPVRSAATPWYQQLWARVVLAIIIILALIGWLVTRRRKAAAKAPKPSLADSFGATPFGREADAAVDADAPEPEDGETAPVYTVDDDGEDELLAQLAEHPDNIDLHLELVSLYYARGDVAQFEGAAEDMHPYVTDDDSHEWQEVVAMGRELTPDHPLFADAAEGVAGGGIGRHDGSIGRDEAWHADAEAAAAEPEEATEPVEEYAFEEPPEPAAHAVPEFETPATSLPDESEFDALPPLPVEADAVATAAPEEVEPVLAEADEDTDFTSDLGTADVIPGGFTDDPVDTKLDLARAYMDMGDHDGAQAMLVEALNEGSQAQKEVAQKLLDELG